MSVVIIGTCGNCGGPVEVPTAYMSIYPPVPSCRHCGAQVAKRYGPTLDMCPAPKKRLAVESWAKANPETREGE